MFKLLLPLVPLAIYCLTYLALFGAWFATVLLQTPDAAQIVSYIHDTLLALTAHVLTVLQAPTKLDPSAPAPDKQTGRAAPLLLALIAIATVLALSGCASVQQAVSGYNAAAARGLRATEDTNIEMWTFNVCATPFSAAVRHPEIIAAMRALCLPNGAAGSPSTLLDAAQTATVPK